LQASNSTSLDRSKEIVQLDIMASLGSRKKQVLLIPTTSDFHFYTTIRSFGFYALAPNVFDKVKEIFSRPMHIGQKVVHIQVKHVTPPSSSSDTKENTIGESSNKGEETPLSQSQSDANSQEEKSSVDSLSGQPPLLHHLRVDCSLLSGDAAESVDVEQSSSSNSDSTELLDKQEIDMLKGQLNRMFRLDFDITEFHSVFPTAKTVGYGRSFRSPNLFEDCIKTFTNCNTTFQNTKMMNRLLCEQVGTHGAFPTVAQLANIDEKELMEKCKVGYRAKRMIQFAMGVEDGSIDLNWLERADTTSDAAKKKLLSLNGFGEFSANNVLQLLGHYEQIPADSETARYLRERHNHSLTSKESKMVAQKAQEVFQVYSPYQFLVYWFELYKFHNRAQNDQVLTQAEEKGFGRGSKTPPKEKRTKDNNEDDSNKKPRKSPRKTPPPSPATPTRITRSMSKLSTNTNTP